MVGTHSFLTVNLLYWGMFSYTWYQKSFLYNSSPTLDNMVPDCNFMIQVYVLYQFPVSLQTADVYKVCSSGILNPNISKIKILQV